MTTITRIISFLLILLQSFQPVEVKECISVNSEWSILVTAEGSESEKYAVRLLSQNIEKALGYALPVVNKAEDKFIAVNVKYDGMHDFAENGYAIKADENRVYINGSGIRGTLYGVYCFLEQFCGLKVYTKDITVINKTDKIEIPDDTDIVYSPYFEYTDTDWLSPRDSVYSNANGLTGGVYRTLSDEMGGAVNYLGSFCHTLTGQFCSASQYFEEHPEYFALRDGKRTDKQLCLTNPDVIKLVTNEVLDLLENKHDKNASLQIVSLTQADNQDYCTCESCNKFEKEHGDVRSATMVNFVNAVADAVKEKGYDNVAIDTFAYQYTRKAPTGIVPRDNVIIRLCTIECCFAHSLDSILCEQNKALMDDLEDWSAICDRIYVWDYTTNYAHTCCVFPDFGVLQKNIQIFYEHNVKGIYEEGNYYIDSCNTEFGELRAYLLSKCMQNPYCNMYELREGFLEAYYGSGGKYIGKALDLMTIHAGNSKGHLFIYASPKDSMVLNDYEVSKIDSYWQQAKDESCTEQQRQNIERSEISWNYWKACVRKGQFSLTNPDRFNEKEKLFNQLIQSGATVMSEGQTSGSYTECASVKYARPYYWTEYKAGADKTKAINFFGDILNFLTPLLSAFGLYYKMTQQLW